MDVEPSQVHTDIRLLDELPKIRSGKAVYLLEPFAKAYLGLYLEIDNSLDPVDRINLLAPIEIAEAVLEGLSAVLQSDIPNIDEIGECVGSELHDPYRYVVLAGMDLMSKSGAENVHFLPLQTRISAICYHYLSSTHACSEWVEVIEDEDIEVTAAALAELWVKLTDYDVHHLPGLHRILANGNYCKVADLFIPALLKEWHSCSHSVHRELLYVALGYVDRSELLSICSDNINKNQDGLRKYVNWLAVAYILAPDEYLEQLEVYASHSREKILRLLDFITGVMKLKDGYHKPLSARATSRLLSIIAPLFPPRRDAFGALDENVHKIMGLFEMLADNPANEVIEAVKWLRSIRVMRVYSDAMDALANSLQP